MRRTIASGLTTSLLLASSPALAQGAPPATAEAETSAEAPADPDEALGQAAEELYNEAREARLDDDYATCHAKADLAWRAEKHPKIAALLGDCALELGRPLEAMRHLEFFFANLPNKVPDKFLEHAQKRLDAARGELGQITVRVTPPAAEVRIDDELPETSGATWVLPGPHEVSASADGFAPTTRQVSLVPGQQLDVQLELIPLSPTPAGGAPPEQEEGSDLPMWPAFAVGGVGLIAIGVGAGLLAAASSAESDADTLLGGERLDAGNDNPCNDPARAAVCADIASLRSDEETFHNAGVGVIVTGSVLAAGAAAYTIGVMAFGMDSGDFAMVSPWASPEGGGAVLRARF